MPPAKEGGRQMSGGHWSGLVCKQNTKTLPRSKYEFCPSKYYATCLAWMSIRDEGKFVSRNATVIVRPKCLVVNLGALLITTLYTQIPISNSF